MRRIVPSAGGSSLILPFAASALPLFEAGEVLVRQRSVSATPGIEAFAYEGPVEALPGELGEAVGGDSQAAHALVLLVRSPAAWAALSALVRTS